MKTSSLRNDARVFINNSDVCLAPIAVYDIFCRALANCSHGHKIKDKDSRAKTISNFQSFVSYPQRAARLSLVIEFGSFKISCTVKRTLS